MDDAEDDDLLAFEAVKDDVLSHPEDTESGTRVIALPTKQGVLADSLECVLK